jgi:hypothetical protein
VPLSDLKGSLRDCHSWDYLFDSIIKIGPSRVSRAMNTQVDEIAARIYRLSTFVPEITAPAGFTFNQYLIDAEEPLLFQRSSHDVSFGLGGIRHDHAN